MTPIIKTINVIIRYKRLCSLALICYLSFQIAADNAMSQCVFDADSIKVNTFLDRGESSIDMEWHDFNALLPYVPYIWIEGVLTYQGQKPMELPLEESKPLFQATLFFEFQEKVYETKILLSGLIDEPIAYFPIRDSKYILTPNMKVKVTFGGVILSEEEYSQIKKYRLTPSARNRLRQMKKCGITLSKICKDMVILRFVFDTNNSGLSIIDVKNH